VNLQNFDSIRDKVKSCLEPYLAGFGINTSKRFPCPIHNGKDNNAGIIPGANLIHCFSCGQSADIFDIAAAKEGKPLTGRGFITDNLLYLAKRFGIEAPELDISDEELYEIQTMRAYSQASRIIQFSEVSDQVKNKLIEYMWSPEVIQKIGIGSVKSYEDYIERMTVGYGHKLEFLMEIDLAGVDKTGKPRQHYIFQPGNLIYTIRGVDGSPIAFSARNLNYETDYKTFESKVDEINSSSKTTKQKEKLIDELWKPRKYINTKTTKIFEKKKVLFNFNEAKKSANKNLIVLEGNADCVTLYAGGIKSAVACCGTAFTNEHIDLALANGITKIILIFDADEAGEKGTKRFIDTLSQYGDHPGLEVSMIQMPEGTDDPDSYIRAFGNLRKGVQEFRKLPQTDLFSWKIKESLESGGDPITICNESVPLIINQPNDLFRLEMADRLANATGVPQEFVRREVLRRIDEGESRTQEAIHLIATETARALTKDPKAINSILSAASAKIEVIEHKKVGYDPTVVLKHTQSTMNKMRSDTSTSELTTNYPIFDSIMGGIPKEGAMISMPGKPFHSKSCFIDNLIVRMLENNPDAQIMLHHVDDASLLRLPRILGIMSGVPSRLIMKAGSSILGLNGEKFEEKFNQVEAKLLNWVEQERLILADQSILDSDLTSLDRWVKQIRRKHPDKHMVVIGDNFHLFSMPGYEEGENKVREMSKFISSMATKHGLTTIFTMELSKEVCKPGVRPRYTDSKNSGGIAFDSKVNINIYQELQDFSDSQLTWTSPDYMERIIGPSGEELLVEKTMPIIEVILDKNKITGEKKTIFFKLEPNCGRMEECSEAEQSELKDKVAATAKDKNNNVKSYGDKRAF
jgi:DNA primase